MSSVPDCTYTSWSTSLKLHYSSARFRWVWIDDFLWITYNILRHFLIMISAFSNISIISASIAHVHRDLSKKRTFFWFLCRIRFLKTTLLKTTLKQVHISVQFASLYLYKLNKFRSTPSRLHRAYLSGSFEKRWFCFFMDRCFFVNYI